MEDSHEPDSHEPELGHLLEGGAHASAETLRAIVGSGANPSSETRDGLTATIQSLLDAGAAAGTVRGDVDARDVFASLTGVFLASGAPDQRERAGRMLDLLMDGLRPRPGS